MFRELQRVGKFQRMDRQRSDVSLAIVCTQIPLKRASSSLSVPLASEKSSVLQSDFETGSGSAARVSFIIIRFFPGSDGLQLFIISIFPLNCVLKIDNIFSYPASSLTRFRFIRHYGK